MNAAVSRRFASLCALWLAWAIAPLRADDPPPPADVPKGEISEFDFADSKIFPGTTRHVWVYVPRQYDPARPACLYVNQDGIAYKAPEVFNQLIHKGEMPVTIGVFVAPGRAPALVPGAADRGNRAVEYDTPTDDYVRFLIEELLPAVEQRKTSDGRPIHLSHDGNDRCIAGASSGAICAFTAAWERPDSFHRVFSTVGSYVDFRGGDCYPMLIRKSEPKPLRVFLQDGSTDLNNYGGDWWMVNQTMERALVFSGYEVNHAWDDRGHNTDGATVVFADAMRWIWKDWPAPIKSSAGSPQLQEIVLPGEPWKLVVDGLKMASAPAANARGEVDFTDSVEGKTYHIDREGKVAPAAERSPGVIAQAFGPDGGLYSLGAQGLVGPAGVIDPKARPGELVVSHDGSIYLTQPAADDSTPSQIWCFGTQGIKKVIEVAIKHPTGVALFPDHSLLLVADGHSHWVYSFQIAADGSLENGQRFHYLHVPASADHASAGGLAVDSTGRLYVATNLGVQVCDPAGRPTCILPTPTGRPTQLCFAGEEFDTLVVTCGDTVYRRKLKVEGVPGHATPIKPEKPKL
jgi:gluconolactonase